MSSKAAEESVKKLVALGYSKSKAQKAMKDVRNNYQQAKMLLEKNKEEEAKKAREAELAVKAKALAEQQAKEAKAKREEAERLAAEGLVEDLSKVKKHPCIVQYGSCRYGQACLFKDLPADTCINYIKGNCIYGESCGKRHALQGVDIRKLMDPTGHEYRDTEFLPLDNGDVVAIDRRGGKVQVGERWVPQVQPDVAAAPLPDPSAFSGDGGSAPTYSEPLGGGGHVPYSAATAGPPFGYQQQQQQQAPPGHHHTTGGSNNNDEGSDFWGGVVAGTDGGMVDQTTGQSFTLKPNAVTPNGVGSPFGSPHHQHNTAPAANPTPFLTRVLQAKNLPQQQQQQQGYYVQREGQQPQQRFPPSPGQHHRPPSACAHPCVVQMGDCRFGKRCMHADIRGDVCVHWLNSRCKYSAEECRYYHESIPAGGSPSVPQSHGSPMKGPPTPLQVGHSTLSPVMSPGAAPPPTFAEATSHMASAAASQTSPPVRATGSSTPGGLVFGTGDSIWSTTTPPPAPGARSVVGGSAARIHDTSLVVEDNGESSAWQRTFGPAADATVVGTSEEQMNAARRMAHDSGLGEESAPTQLPGSRWLVEGPSAVASGRPTADDVGGGSSSSGLATTANDEARAFESLMEVFPDADPAAVFQALRRCGNDRDLVAQVLTEGTPDHALQLLNEAGEADDDAMAAAIAVAELHDEEERRAEQESCTGSLALVTLCSLIPALEPSELERILKEASFNFELAFAVATHRVEKLAAPLPSSDSGTHRTGSRWGGTVRGADGNDTGLTPAEAMRLDRLVGMYRDLEPQLVRNTFVAADRNMQTAIDQLNWLHTGLKDIDASARLAAGRAAVSAPMATAAPTRTERRRSTPDSFTVTSDDSPTLPSKPLPSQTALYHETKKEAQETSDWRRTRQEAYMHNAARQQMQSLAVAALGRRQHDVAKELLRKARVLQSKYERLNMLAMHALEREKMHAGTNTLDLHGFHVEEALDVLNRRISLCERKGVRTLAVVVGHGNHSRSGKSVVYPAVMDFLKGSQVSSRVSIKSILPAQIVVHIEPVS